MSGDPGESEPREEEQGNEKDEASPGSAKEAARKYSYDSVVPENLVHTDVKARNAFVNGTFNGPVTINDAAGDPLFWVERSALAAQLSKGYVSTTVFDRLQGSMVTSTAVIAVCGPAGAGKTAACLVALHRRGHDPVIEVPADLEWKNLLRTIKEVKEVAGKAAFLLQGADVEFVESLDDFHLARLTDVLNTSAPSQMLITSNGSPESNRGNALVIRVDVPSAADLIDSYFTARPVGEDVAARVKRMIGPLETLDFGTLEALVKRTLESPEAADAELVAGLSDRAVLDALDAWFVKGRSAREVATLVCVATCEGGPRIEIDQQILRVENGLLGVKNEAKAGQEQQPLFGVAPTAATKGVVVIGSERFGTEFGRQREDVYWLAEPLVRQVVITDLWGRLGADFRDAYVRWLRTVASAPNAPVRLGAPLAAGVLLGADPRYVVEALLRVWALSGERHLIEAAATALGVPTVLNDRTTVGRQLASTWIGDDNDNLRRCAVLAYAGPLGAWDLGCGAPGRLWRTVIHDDDEELREMAAHGLAALCAAGTSAAQIRFTVLNLLATQAGTRRSTSRQALEIFGLVVGYLTADRSPDRDSFDALLDPAESPALDAFCSLLARCWSMPLAKDVGDYVTSFLVAGAEDQAFRFEALLDLVRMAKAVSRRTGTAPSLGLGLRRGLVLELRANPDSTVATRLLRQFFPDHEVKS
ncbi:hypothetical protein [Kribbella lupini]|uniref:HEAT repeat protein n=1 Tax=Kribbella lupini TaxID=291602 RepID=A0ABP4L711_9ACTN